MHDDNSTTSTCPHCGGAFACRSNKIFCSSNCRKRNAEAVLLLERNNEDKPLRPRRSIERKATLQWIYEKIFSTKPQQRADVLLAMLIFAAITGTKSYIDLFTYPNAMRSNRFTVSKKGTAFLHFRGKPEIYPATLAAMGNHLCIKFFGINSRQFIDEIRRDGVTMADMQSVYDELMDTDKADPVVRDIDIEEPTCRAGGSCELTPEQITHAERILAEYHDYPRKASGHL